MTNGSCARVKSWPSHLVCHMWNFCPARKKSWTSRNSWGVSWLIVARSGFLLCSTCRGWRSYEMWPQCVMKRRSCIFLRGFKERDARSTLICRADDWRHSPWSTEISLTCPYRLFLYWLSWTWTHSGPDLNPRPLAIGWISCLFTDCCVVSAGAPSIPLQAGCDFSEGWASHTTRQPPPSRHHPHCSRLWFWLVLVCAECYCEGGDDKRIPLLRDVFDAFPNTPVNIDIKSNNDTLIKKVFSSFAMSYLFISNFYSHILSWFCPYRQHRCLIISLCI